MRNRKAWRLELQHVMFDIDGTLVQSLAYDTSLFATAIEEVLDMAVNTDWSS